MILKKYSAPDEIHALLVASGMLYVINLSRVNVRCLLEPDNTLARIKDTDRIDEASVANELLKMLKEVASKGWIRSDVDADTGVGRTLENRTGNTN